MKNILVTGATGFIGSNLIIRLLELGHNVRAFHRSNSNSLTLKSIDVEHYIGDTRDRDSLRNAMRGCDTVFHTAAVVSFWRKKYPELYSTNVDGTKNIVEVCLETGVEKLIHTSSIAALGFRTDGQLIDENTVYNWGTKIGYKYSKHLAELEVFKGIEKGLNAVIVNPSVVVGPRDIYIHGGQIIRDIKRRTIPVYIEGGMNIVNVCDVVAGHIAAAKLGRTG
ncbi:MAG TPA: NAD-dependent epimerase/dehydratase family protein, partial [Bacteroidota bacterium]|nr:NAD-dependent epimerase/dehydratase family protein [Bacteroidota bacterium]